MTIPLALSRRTTLLLAAIAPHCKPRAQAPSARPAAQRIVSIAPNTTEMLFAMQLGSRVVGVSSLCDFPDEVRTLPKVGALGSLSLEAILALRPDAVVGAPGAAASLIDRLQAQGIRVSLTAVESVDSVRSLARALSDLCHAPDALQRWSTAFERELQQAQSVFAPPNGRAPRVLAVIDQRPLVCAGPGSYIDELVRLSHGQNALSSGPAWPQLSMESVLRSAPDVVLDLCGPLAQEPLRRAWQSYATIPAVRDNRVIAVADPLVTRPGPRAPQAIELVSHALRRAMDTQGTAVAVLSQRPSHDR